MKRIIVFIFLLLVTGCVNPHLQVKSGSIIINNKDAEKAWSRTQSYVARNGSYRINVISDYVVETYFLYPRENNFNVQSIGYTVTREINDNENLYFLKLYTYDFNGEYLERSFNRLSKYISTGEADITFKIGDVDKHEKPGDINDLKKEVAEQALKEMSEKELKTIIEGLSEKSLEVITIEQLRKLYRLEYSK